MTLMAFYLLSQLPLGIILGKYLGTANQPTGGVVRGSSKRRDSGQ